MLIVLYTTISHLKQNQIAFEKQHYCHPTAIFYCVMPKALVFRLTARTFMQTKPQQWVEVIIKTSLCHRHRNTRHPKRINGVDKNAIKCIWPFRSLFKYVIFQN